MNIYEIEGVGLVEGDEDSIIHIEKRKMILDKAMSEI